MSRLVPLRKMILAGESESFEFKTSFADEVIESAVVLYGFVKTFAIIQPCSSLFAKVPVAL